MITANDAMVAADELSVLTPKQREYLTLTAKGLSQKEIASLRGVSEKAVSQQMLALHQRTGLTTIEAVVLAVKAGWV